MAAGRGLYSAGVGEFIAMADEDAMVKQARWKPTRPPAAQSWGRRCRWPSQSAVLVREGRCRVRFAQARTWRTATVMKPSDNPFVSGKMPPEGVYVTEAAAPVDNLDRNPVA